MWTVYDNHTFKHDQESSTQLIEWLQKNYCVAPESFLVPIEDLYNTYLRKFCQPNGSEPYFKCEFGKFVHKAFPHIKIKRRGPLGAQISHYSGIQEGSPTPASTVSGPPDKIVQQQRLASTFNHYRPRNPQPQPHAQQHSTRDDLPPLSSKKRKRPRHPQSRSTTTTKMEKNEPTTKTKEHKRRECIDEGGSGKRAGVTSTTKDIEVDDGETEDVSDLLFEQLASEIKKFWWDSEGRHEGSLLADCSHCGFFLSPMTDRCHTPPSSFSAKHPQHLLFASTTPLHSPQYNRPASRPAYDPSKAQYVRYTGSCGRPLLLPPSPQQLRQQPRQQQQHRPPLPQREEDTRTLAFFISDILFPPSISSKAVEL